MTRMICKSWSDQKPFTRRARWYAEGVRTHEELYCSVRLEFTELVITKRQTGYHYPKTEQEANELWDAFKNGDIDFAGRSTYHH